MAGNMAGAASGSYHTGWGNHPLVPPDPDHINQPSSFLIHDDEVETPLVIVLPVTGRRSAPLFSWQQIMSHPTNTHYRMMIQPFNPLQKHSDIYLLDIAQLQQHH